MSEQTTESGIPIKPLYTPADIAHLDYASRLNDPGSYPFTRGARAHTSGRATWIQRELSGEGDAARSNEQFKYLLSKGMTGLDVIGDTPTVALLDPDHPYAAHTVGNQGVSICCLDDFRVLYRDLPLDRITLSHSLPGTYSVAALHTVARERGVDPRLLRGSVIQSPYYCEDCSYATHLPFALRLRMAADNVAFCAAEMPKFHAFVEDTYYISDGGINAVEEMALGFIEIRGIIRELLTRGVPIDSFAPRIAILVNCRMDFFEEIAKIRATRRLYARMMRDEFGARDPRSLAVNITVHTSGLSLTAQQPVNNIVRGTTQALASVLAGAHAVEVSTFDEAFRTPSEEAHLVGLRTQQIIQLESNVTRVADPLGGSYYIESLTDEMERRIWDMVEHIEKLGDPAQVAESGWFRALFQRTMERYTSAITDGSQPKVGVNVFTVPEEEDRLLRDVATAKIEPYRERIDFVRAYRAQRDNGRVHDELQALHAVAKDPRGDLMPPIISATSGGATIGEMTGVLRMAYGQPADPFGMCPNPI